MKSIVYFERQTDLAWAEMEIVRGVPIKDYGCLLVCLSNIIRSEISYKKHFTPNVVLAVLRVIKSFTENGLLLWASAEKVFNFKHRNLGKTFTDRGNYYILQVPYRNTGHFVNLLEVDNNNYMYYDVYDGIKKSISRNAIISIREIEFGK
jgi:hypothetical protein